MEAVDDRDLAAGPDTCVSCPEPFLDVAPALGALAWEVDRDTLTMRSVSAAAHAVTGFAEHEIVGLSSWTNRLPDTDRDELISRGRALEPGERTHLAHRLMHADGAETWMHTSMVGTVASDGRRTVLGVSIRREPPSPAGGSPGRARSARLIVRRSR